MATGNPFTTAQAPSALSPVSLIAPDVATEQQQLGRRQQLADYLRSKALEDNSGTQVIGGWAIKKSPLEGLSKVAQAFGSNYAQEGIDAKQQELAKKLQERMGMILGGDGNTPAPIQVEDRQDPNAMGPQAAATVQGVPQPVNNFNMGNLIRGQVINDIGGQGASAAYWDQFKPTEGQKTDKYLGISQSDSRNAELAKRMKEGYIAPVNARPGSILRDPVTNKPLAFNPHIPEGSVPTFDASGNVIGMAPIEGATNAISAAERAKAMGTAQATPTVVYKGATPAFSTKAQDVERATGLTPMAGPSGNIASPGYNGGDRNGANVESVRAMTEEMNKPGITADVKAGLQREIDRMKQQTPNADFSSVTPQLPPGLTANADAAQKASAQTMHTSYGKLQSGNSTAQAALDALEKMQGLAAKKNALFTAGVLGKNQSAVNPDAAEYEKQRANLIAQLAQQNGTNGTDAGRLLTADSVPDFGKPKSAIADGLATLKNQTVAQQLKANFLTPHYQAGDSKKYTEMENKFDQNISPAMVPMLTAPPGPERAAMLKQAAQNPAMRARLEWAAQNGLLK